ncbi:hypothetical protein PCH_Pc16g06550 [Penicillium rubens Wisconsin 54-1255]|uniref:Uncharacterized protein n=1 Tax=Penicillium rubens (strain ATCC 28089 / DSM 1075 / NRRL 1951 / Wisconsin 54-1255) TaxID=500485 RepID=B6H7C7_PENRW|nr:hypothetical protein PCH_Pc16g06550 [Penicillium rubens Wisconsin 54-1255]
MTLHSTVTVTADRHRQSRQHSHPGLGPRALYPNTGIHHLTASALNADRVGRIGSFTPSRHFAWFPSSSYPPLSIAQRFLVQSASVDLPPPCSLPIPSRIVPYCTAYRRLLSSCAAPEDFQATPAVVTDSAEIAADPLG